MVSAPGCGPGQSAGQWATALAKSRGVNARCRLYPPYPPHPKHGGCIKHSCLQKWGPGLRPSSCLPAASDSQVPGLVALQCVKPHPWERGESQ